MRTKIAFPTLLALVFVLSGCMSQICNPRPPALAADAVPIKTEHTVALLNATTSTGKTHFATVSLFWKYYVNLHDVGETAVGWAKPALAKLNVKVDDRAEKKLWLSIPKAYGKQGVWIMRADVVLKVKTGNGLEKEFIGQQRFFEDYTITPAIEQATRYCVSQMLKDKDILDYLRQ